MGLDYKTKYKRNKELAELRKIVHTQNAQLTNKPSYTRKSTLTNMKKQKSIFQTIRKTTAPPTSLFKNKREQLLIESIEQDDVIIKKIHPGFDHNGECLECDGWPSDCICTADEFDFNTGEE